MQQASDIRQQYYVAPYSFADLPEQREIAIDVFWQIERIRALRFEELRLVDTIDCN